MPVRRFHSVADMPGPPPRRPLDPGSALCSSSARLPIACARGVFLPACASTDRSTICSMHGTATLNLTQPCCRCCR